MAMVLIEYVGKQRNRADDVLKTPRIWEGPGSAVEVPASEKHAYLAHPGEWREISREDYSRRMKAREAFDAELEEFDDEIEDLTIPDLERLRDRVNTSIEKKQAAIRAAGATAVDKPPAPSSDQPPVGGKNADDASNAASMQRLIQIKAAIEDMDPKNDEHFSGQTGRPYVSAVSEVIGFKVTAQEIDDAMTLGQSEQAED